MIGFCFVLCVHKRRAQVSLARAATTALAYKYPRRGCRLKVLYPLGVHKMENIKVASLSGGELQRVAICICLGTPAQIYLLDEPSAGPRYARTPLPARGTAATKKVPLTCSNPAASAAESIYNAQALTASSVSLWER